MGPGRAVPAGGRSSLTRVLTNILPAYPDDPGGRRAPEAGHLTANVRAGIRMPFVMLPGSGIIVAPWGVVS